MISGNTAKRQAVLSDTQQISRKTGKLLSRKLWLPKLLYAALPYFYLLAGCAALIATVYIGHWSWVLPHYLLFAGACLHMGALVYRRRKQSKAESE